MKKYLSILFIFVICFVLIGCGNIDINYDLDNEEVINQNETNENQTDTADEIELYSDDEKIVFANGQSKLVYYYVGEEITAYHTYINYETNAAANYALSIIEKDDETIEKAYTKGKYLVIEYAKSEYENTTVSEIKALYSYLEQVQKEN